MNEKVKYIHCTHCHQYSNIEGVAHTEYIKCSKCGEQIQLYIDTPDGRLMLFKQSKSILVPMSNLDIDVIKNFYNEVETNMLTYDDEKR